MTYVNELLFAGTLLLLASVLLSAGAARIGAPVLLVFLLIGMLAGEDGPGGIRFDDITVAFAIGNIALAVILFDGGLRTRLELFRVGLGPALALSTVGVAITGAVVGAFAAWILDVGWLHGLLMGAIVGSTDAAAVFALLQGKGLRLNERVASTLEVESGSNDPMAVFLTVALIALVTGQVSSGPGVLWLFVQQMGIGALVGLLGGRALAWLVDRVSIADGLYPLLAFSGGIFLFALVNLVGGSGFLAVYLAGIVVGNSRLRGAARILQVHDGIAWLCQISMFLVLGLLVTPSELIPVSGKALAVALVLMLIARPLAVWICLLPFTMPWREFTFIAWVGLRGAVPIVLAMFPLMAGTEHARVLFNVAFFVVLTSLVLQGWTIPVFARWLRLEIPIVPEPLQRVELDVTTPAHLELVGLKVEAGSGAEGMDPNDLPFGAEGHIAAHVRPDAQLAPGQHEALRANDMLYVVMPAADASRMQALFSTNDGRHTLAPREFYGMFVVDGDARVSDLCSLYGGSVEPADGERSVSELFAARFHGRAVEGDRLPLGAFELVVREIEGKRVRSAGLRIPRTQASEDQE